MYTLPIVLFVSMWSLAFADPIHVRQGEPLPSSELTPPTPTSSSDFPSSSPALFFAQINEMTTCTPATISWLYGGPDVPVTLVITNQGVPQLDPPSSSSSSQDTDTQTSSSSLFSLLTDGAVTPRAVPTGVNPIDASNNETMSFTASALQMNYTWQNVTLPQGWYQAIAVFSSDSFIATSQLFFIQNGSDTSCLSALSTPSPSSSASSTDSASATTTTPPTSSPSPSTGSALPATQLGSSKVSKGAIAGGVIGGLAILAAALGAFIFLRCTRASTRRAHSTGSGGGSRGWGGLASVDSTHRGAGHAKKNATPKSYTDIGLISEDPFNPRAERHQSQADSLGPVVSSQTNLGGIAPAVSSDEEVNSYGFAPSEEKFGSPGDDTIAPLAMYHPQQQHQQQSPHPNPHPTALQTQRSSSGSASGSSPPRYQSEYTPSPTASSPRRGSNEYAYPPSPTSPDMHRTPSTGGGGGGSTRRTARKPVPAYNPSDVTLDAPHSVAHSWSTGAPVGASASDLGHGHAHAEYDPFGEVGMGGKGRGGLPIPIPELNHKSSFGDTKPVHYLIPDMPPSMR